MYFEIFEFYKIGELFCLIFPNYIHNEINSFIYYPSHCQSSYAILLIFRWQLQLLDLQFFIKFTNKEL